MLENKFIRSIVVLAVVVVVFMAGWFSSNYAYARSMSSAEDVSTSYLELVLSGKSEEAYAKVTPTIRKTITAEQLKSNLGNVASKEAKITAQTTVKVNDRYVSYYTVENLPKLESGSTKGIFTIVVAKDEGKLGVESSVVQ